MRTLGVGGPVARSQIEQNLRGPSYSEYDVGQS